MLKIRAEQMRRFAEPLEARFHDRVQAFLRQQAPELLERAGPDAAQAIAEACSDAAALGCETEQELALFSVLSLLHGRDFTLREPWSSVVAAHHRAQRRGGLPMALMDASRRAGEAV